MQADLDMDSNDILNAGRILVGGTDYLAQALAARNAAIVAQNAAETAETNAETAETNAEASEVAAEASENAASTSATNAASSASSAASSASTATTQAGVATTQATAASASASAAATSEANASTSETNAAASASAASTSETNAASSASSAQASKDAALAALDSFDDRYLGQKASDPTLDNDGDPLVAGALYFNTTDDVMKVYEGSVWVAAYASLSGALLSANNLSDLNSVSASRTNLGLGSAATTASTDYATAAQGTLADSAVQPGDLATVATTGAYSDLTGKPTLYSDSSVDTHLNTGTATSGEYLSWNGSDYNWTTVPAGYTDSDVDTHLNYSTATTGQVLSFSGSDYDWVDAASGATGGGSDEIFWENGQNVTTNYTITNGKNAMSAGPITINSGVTVTVGAGEVWTVV
jgi:hypothetical protein